MAQPQWITAAGSLGVIPEDVFYTQALVAVTPPLPIPAICTATAATTNRITCDTTADAAPGLVVRFTGTNFGGLEENVAYFVLSVISATEFTISAAPDSTIPVTLTTAVGNMTARFSPRVYYRIQAGTVPSGVQISTTGVVTGVPQAVASLQGVPTPVNQDITSKFTVRAYTLTDTGAIGAIADRTFTITVSGNDPPDFVTPAGNVGTYYDGDEVDIQIVYVDDDPDDFVLIRVVSGALPLGLRLSETGRIFGYIKPFPDPSALVGYDLSASDTAPYDFLSQAISKNYQFTLEITDGKTNNLRTFEIFVYNRADLTADDTYITSDNTFVTADQTTERAPFLTNAAPSNIGTVRGDNYFAFRFIGQDYDDTLVEYAITVNQGIGLPPGLQLDPYSGWYYGFIPDVGITQTTYSFNIQVRSRSLVCTATDSATDIITCDQNTRGDFYLGAAVTFEGTVFGGVSIGVTYYVANIVSDTQFQISATIAGPVFALTLATGRMLAVPEDISASRFYPFTLTVTGAVDREVVWLTDGDLGIIENGDTSDLKIEAVNRGGVPLLYQLRSGAFNELPQGLTLLPSGEIAGRVTFNTFSVDLGATTFDASQSDVSRISPTTFDSTFRFVGNAFAEDPKQPLFKVSYFKIINGGTGFTSAPSLVFNNPEGATAIQATATVQVASGTIIAVTVTNAGAEYTAPATFTLTGVGSGAVLEVVMQSTGVRRIISADRDFIISVARTYSKPYQNLYIVAMPPQNDRALLAELLNNPETFVPEYIFRPDDPNFGVTQQVIYLHAVGLAPEILNTYVQSLNLNHYWKNLVLGEIETAQAVDAAGNVIYEIVYSRVIDNLVNNQGASVGKIVTLPYSISDPADSSTLINSVYPNSLVNMRDQVIDVVGQISTKLPLWMTSKQVDGSVLGFTPAWVICYTNPGRSRQIAYYIDRNFSRPLNLIDFKVDRYVVDSLLTKNWSAENQNWTPAPSLTTFDRVNTQGFADLGLVQACTELAYTDIQNRTLAEINVLGGLDGQTWIEISGQTPPVGTRVIITNGSRLIFVKQEAFNNFFTTDAAFTDNIGTYDSTPFDSGNIATAPGSFDYGVIVPGGRQSVCGATSAATDLITCQSTLAMSPGDKVWFTGTVFGGIAAISSIGTVQLYRVFSVAALTITATFAATSRLTVGDTSALTLGDEVWFPGATLGGIAAIQADGSPRSFYIVDIPNATQIQLGNLPGGTPLAVTNSSGNVQLALPAFQVELPTAPGVAAALTTATGSMTVNYNNLRLAIYNITILPGDILQLGLDQQTITNDFVTSTQGQIYAGGTTLYRPGEAAGALTRINWQPLLSQVAVITAETIFDQNSLQFVEPVDMYNPTDEFDKYLVFPKANILV